MGMLRLLAVLFGAYVLLVGGYFVLNQFGFIEMLLVRHDLQVATLISLLFGYPSIACSYFFWRQTGQRRWGVVCILTALLTGAIFLLLFEVLDASRADPQEGIVLVTLILTQIAITIVVVATASMGAGQTVLVRRLGAMVWIVALATVLVTLSMIKVIAANNADISLIFIYAFYAAAGAMVVLSAAAMIAAALSGRRD